MLSDPGLAIQKAVVAALRGNTDAGASVFDTVPAASPFPRITIGTAQTLANEADCYNGSEIFFQVDVWSRGVGFPQAKEIAGDVRDVLHDAPLVLEGHVLDLLKFRDSQALVDPDGTTRHVAMTFRALTQPEETT